MSVCVCVCMNSCISHPARISQIESFLTGIIFSSLTCLSYFSTLSHKRQDFRGGELLNIKCVLIFSTNFVQNTSRSQKDSARYYVKCTWVFMSITRYSFHILSKLTTLGRFSKSSNIRFNLNLLSGSRVVPCGGMDRYDEANIRFSLCCKRT
jgi:hypothetical protein